MSGLRDFIKHKESAQINENIRQVCAQNITCIQAQSVRYINHQHDPAYLVRFLFCFPPSDRPSLSPDPSSFKGLDVELFDEVVTSDRSLMQSEEGTGSKG